MDGTGGLRVKHRQLSVIENDPLEALDPRSWLTLTKLIHILLGRWYLLLGAALAAGGLAWLGAQQIAPTYRVGADILIEADSANVVDIEKVAEEGKLNDSAMLSEAALLRSQTLLRDVAARLQTEVGAFPRKSKPPVVKAVRDLIGRVLPAPEPQTADAAPRVAAPVDRLDWMARFLQANLEVKTARSSRVIELSFTAVEPQFAALAATRIAEHYVQSRHAARTAATDRAGVWLTGQVERLRAVLADSEARLERARREAGIEKIGDTPVPTYQLLELTRRLGQAKSELAAAVGRYEYALTGTTDDAVDRSPMLAQLRGEEAAQLAKLAELRVKYRATHPTLAAADAALAETRQRIAFETERARRTLQQDAALAQRPVVEIQAEIERLLGEVSTINESEVLLASLESEVSANRALFDTLLQRLKELDGQELLQEPGARIINRPAVPRKPVSPPTKLMVALAVLLGVGGTVVLILFREVTRRDFRDSEHVEAVLGPAHVGVVPDRPPLAYRLAGGLALGSDARDPGVLQVLDASMASRVGEGETRTVLVTSALPGEGKSLTSLRLAAAAAGTKRCLLIECNMKEPSLCQYLDKPAGPGLSDVLAGEVSITECLRRDRMRGIDFLPAGRMRGMTFDPTATARLDSLLRELAPLYDLILLDGPALLSARGTVRLSELADYTIMIVRPRSTPVESVSRALRTPGWTCDPDLYLCVTGSAKSAVV